MKSSIVQCFLVVGLVFAYTALGHAQEAIHGQVSDASGKPIPGVTVKAVNTGTGETEQVQTDKDGLYRITIRTGNYTITSSIQGFGSGTQTIEVLVGAQPELNFTMTAGGGDTVVVAAAPVTNANSGNITQQQVENIPSNGRNQIDLTTMAPRSDTNAVINDSFVARERGNSQIVMDGQQITVVILAGFGQPHFSKDAVEEMQMGDRFDATQGRSSKLIANEVTKSGTNQFLGRASGYFRNDLFNSEDPIRKVVLPYSDQQLSFTFGGPIIKDKLHFFANYEYERNPQSYPYTTAFVNTPSWNVSNVGIERIDTEGARLDYQRGQNHLMFRADWYDDNRPLSQQYYNGTVNTPAGTDPTKRNSTEYWATYSQVLSPSSVNVIRAGYSSYTYDESSQIKNPQSAYPGTLFAGLGGVTLSFAVSGAGASSNPASGFVVGQNHANAPEDETQYLPSARDDYTKTFDWHGGHTFKTGAEYLYMKFPQILLWSGNGSVSLTIPTTVGSNLPLYFPNLYDESTWYLGTTGPIGPNGTALPGLSQYVTTFVKGVQAPGAGQYTTIRNSYAGWLQDDWRIKPSLTLNFGLRYDLSDDSFGEKYSLPGVFAAGRPIPKNQIAPRLGFTKKMGAKTVLRGGFGKYFGDIQGEAQATPRSYQYPTSAVEQYFGTSATTAGGHGLTVSGVPLSLATLLQQPAPAFASVWANECINNNTNGVGNTGCVRPGYSASGWSPPGLMPFSYILNLGVQRQVGKTTVMSADFYFQGEHHAQTGFSNANLQYNSSGVNLPFNLTGANIVANSSSATVDRPWPNLGTVAADEGTGLSNYVGITTTVTKRVGSRWNGTATYTWSELRDDNGQPFIGSSTTPVQVAKGFEGADYYTYANTDQRNRANFNGSLQLWKGFSLSGLFFFGSGQAVATSYSGSNINNDGLTNGLIVPTAVLGNSAGNGKPLSTFCAFQAAGGFGCLLARNGLHAQQIDRVDMRLTKKFKFGERITSEIFAESFNLLNHDNYGSYTGSVTNANYGLPSYNSALPYQARMAQFGFKVDFKP